MPLLILAWVKNNWKLVAIGLAVLALVTYIGVLRWEVGHYKTKYEDAQAEIVAAQSREAALTATNAGLTRKYANLTAGYNLALEELNKATQEKIKNDKELNSLRISSHAVQLFNDSKRDTPTTVTTTKQGDAGETSTTTTYALSELFTVSAENDKNHLACIKQVETWQNFWQDYSNAVARSENRGP